MIKTNLYLIALLYLTLDTVAQNKIIDTVLAKQYINFAKKFKEQNKSAQAIEYCKKAVVIYDNYLLNIKKENNNTLIQKIYLEKGNVNQFIGKILTGEFNFEEGIPYLLESVDDYEKVNNFNKISIAYNTISNAYHDFGDYRKGIDYAFRALKVLNEHKEEISLNRYWYCYNNLGNNYDDSKQYAKAITAHKNALPYAISGSDSSYSYNNLGNTTKKINQLDKAETFFELSLKTNDDTSDVYHLATITSNLVDIYRLRKNYLTADKYANLALLYTQKSKSPEKLLDLYYYIHQIKHETKKFQEASEYLKKYINLKDSLFTSQKNKAVIHYQTKYEVAKKEKENLSLTIDNEKQKAKNRLIVFIGIGITLFTSLLVWFLMYKRKQLLIKQQTKKLNEAIFDTEQQERQRIARDLHDSVGQKLSVVKMQLSVKDADVNSSSKLLDEAIQDVRNVSHNLMPADLSKGLIVALENMCEQINFSSTSLKIHLNKTEAIVSLNLDKQHTLLIYRMVQELVNNAIKYAKAQNIHISMDCTKNQLNLNLVDDGVGFDINSIENKDGLGIKNIKERVQQMIGNMQLVSKDGNGTQYQISIPI